MHVLDPVVCAWCKIRLLIVRAQNKARKDKKNMWRRAASVLMFICTSGGNHAEKMHSCAGARKLLRPKQKTEVIQANMQNVAYAA